MQFSDIELKFVGTFAVDSGQVLIGDPCYLDEWQNWNQDKEPFDNHITKAGEYGYLGACGVTLEDTYGMLGVAGTYSPDAEPVGRAVVSSSGWGDGYYSVFAEMDEDNRVAKLIIDFEGELEAD